MTNPIPAATHEWHPTETVSLDELRPLVVHLLKVSFPAGSRGDFAHDVPVLAEGTDFRVTAHDYGAGAELHCNCDEWYAKRACPHTDAAWAKVHAARPAAVPAA